MEALECCCLTSYSLRFTTIIQTFGEIVCAQVEWIWRWLCARDSILPNLKTLVLFEWVSPYTNLENNCQGAGHRQGRCRNIFSYMFKQWPLGTTGKDYIKRFWKSVRSGAQYMTHPIRLIDGHEEWAIPIKLHGDGTPVTGLGKSWGKIMDIWCVCNVRSWT